MEVSIRCIKLKLGFSVKFQHFKENVFLLGFRIGTPLGHCLHLIGCLSSPGTRYPVGIEMEKDWSTKSPVPSAYTHSTFPSVCQNNVMSLSQGQAHQRCF